MLEGVGNCTEISPKPKSSAAGLKHLLGTWAPPSPSVIPASREEMGIGRSKFPWRPRLTIHHLQSADPTWSRKGSSRGFYFLTSVLNFGYQTKKGVGSKGKLGRDLRRKAWLWVPRRRRVQSRLQIMKYGEGQKFVGDSRKPQA